MREREGERERGREGGSNTDSSQTDWSMTAIETTSEVGEGVDGLLQERYERGESSQRQTEEEGNRQKPPARSNVTEQHRPSCTHKHCLLLAGTTPQLQCDHMKVRPVLASPFVLSVSTISSTGLFS